MSLGKTTTNDIVPWGGDQLKAVSIPKPEGVTGGSFIREKAIWREPTKMISTPIIETDGQPKVTFQKMEVETSTSGLHL